MVMISAGDIPALSSTLLDTNVLPQTADAANANMWNGHLLVDFNIFAVIFFSGAKVKKIYKKNFAKKFPNTKKYSYLCAA